MLDSPVCATKQCNTAGGERQNQVQGKTNLTFLALNMFSVNVLPFINFFKTYSKCLVLLEDLYFKLEKSFLF